MDHRGVMHAGTRSVQEFCSERRNFYGGSTVFDWYACAGKGGTGLWVATMQTR